jgi:putative aldouronate transport system permease protein
MVFLALVMLVSVIPLWHVLMASISDGRSLLGHSGVAWLPVGGVDFGGYKLLFRDASVMKGYANTIVYVVGATGLGLLFNIMAGYILSRDTKFRSAMILFCIFTTMFSGGTVPTYMVIRKLGMTGTRLAMIIPGCTNAMFMLYMMNSFAGVDRSYEEAAAIDGANHFQIMFQVMLPQCKGMAIVMAINTAIMKWNSWFEASIYVPTQRNLWPLQLWVKEFTAQTTEFLKTANPDYAKYLIQYSVIIIATVPILIALPFFIKKLEKGMVLGGVKG